MNKNIAKEIIHILIAITLSIFAVRFIIWLLPIILIVALSDDIYKYIKKDTRPTKNKNYKKKEIKIIDMEDID